MRVERRDALSSAEAAEPVEQATLDGLWESAHSSNPGPFEFEGVLLPNAERVEQTTLDGLWESAHASNPGPFQFESVLLPNAKPPEAAEPAQGEQTSAHTSIPGPFQFESLLLPNAAPIVGSVEAVEPAQAETMGQSSPFFNGDKKDKAFYSKLTGIRHVGAE